ncbi:MAG: D-alanyl-D-alanine carboxypeptidase/D-alanyl-D-alanine-endopeptidase [Nesterenkonia sp.]
MQAPRSLQEAIQREIDDPMTGRVGLHVVDLDSGHEVFSHNADQTFLLASLTKIFTVGTAIEALGGDTRFTTRFSSVTPVDADGVLSGDLFIRGGGDPTIGSKKHIADKFGGHGTSIDHLAAALRRAGVERVTGNLVADGSLFTPEGRRRTDWISALTFNRTKFADPVIETAQAMADALKAEGVRIEGGATEGTPPGDATEIAAVDSPMVHELAVRAGHASDNFVSEVLTKHLGARVNVGKGGTTAGGCAAIEKQAAGMGAPVKLWNGSGMTRQVRGRLAGNEGTPRDVTAYLQRLRGHALQIAVTECLPRAAQDGTLRQRMRNSTAVGKIRAKTGTLFVSHQTRQPLQDSLAGYCQTDTSTLAFALIYERAETQYAARTSLDRIAAALRA